MKVSIITVCFNAQKYIKSCIDSVLMQDYPEIEYIIIDGKSKDNTVEILKSYGDKITRWISEPDKGLYDAMNKGVALATGEVIGFLNADDVMAYSGAVSDVIKTMQEQKSDAIIGDVVHTKEENLDEVIRHHHSRGYKPSHFEWGMMPAHLSFYTRKKFYTEFGGFDTQFRICADYDLMMRFLYIHKISFYYLPKVLVKMRTGGLSNQGLKSIIRINKEIKKSCMKNNVPTNWLKIYSKYFVKVFQLVQRPDEKQ